MKMRKYQRASDRGSMSWGKFIWYGLVLMAICFALGSGMIYLADIAVEYNKKIELRNSQTGNTHLKQPTNLSK